MTPKFRTLCNMYILCTLGPYNGLRSAHTHIAHASLMDFHAGAKTARQMLGRAAPVEADRPTYVLLSGVGKAQGKA
jgi:hypothetical protein